MRHARGIAMLLALIAAPAAGFAATIGGTFYAVRSTTMRIFVALNETSARVDDDGLAGHGVGSAHRHHLVGAIVLVGGLARSHALRAV